MKNLCSILILTFISCVDRIDIDTGLTQYPVVVEGNISDQPGPYEVRVSRSFDIQSKSTLKEYISAKKITLFDDAGNSEVLTEKPIGFFRTQPNGMQGIVGREYHIKVELLDGRIYESIPDKLLNSGRVDSVYFSFVSEKLADFSTFYGFDVFFNSAIGENSNADFLWKFTGTFQIETNPEAHKRRCGESFCPDPRPCSGYVLGPDGPVEIAPCECCTCWADIFNEDPIVSDGQFVQSGQYLNVKAYRVPLDQWIFMKKIYARIDQLSLTPRALAFWKAIKSQKQANGSLFQPISGVVPNNYVQVSGNDQKLDGFFFATSIKSNGTFITRDDVPNQALIPKRDLPYEESCLTFPRSTNQMPEFWK